MNKEIKLVFEVEDGKTSFYIVSTDPPAEYPHDEEETDKLLYSSDWETANTQTEVKNNFANALAFFELYKEGNAK